MLKKETIIIIAFILHFSAISQNDNFSNEKLVKYLIEQKELNNSINYDSIKLKDFIYNRLLFVNIIDGKSYKVVQFGVLGAHSKKFIALLDGDKTEFLDCSNFYEDYEKIFLFIQKSKKELIETKMVIDIFNVCKYNSTTNWLPR